MSGTLETLAAYLTPADDYEGASFTVNTGTVDYDVKANVPSLFASIVWGRYFRIESDKTISIKFNSTAKAGLTLTASETPWEARFVKFNNIYISNTSGETANIKIILT